MEHNHQKSIFPNPKVIFAHDDEDDNLSSRYMALSEFWCSKKYECDGNHSFSNEVMHWKFDRIYVSFDFVFSVNRVEKKEDSCRDEVVNQPLSPLLGNGGVKGRWQFGS